MLKILYHDLHFPEKETETNVDRSEGCLFVFRDRGREGEREEKKNQLVVSRSFPRGDPALQPRYVP